MTMERKEGKKRGAVSVSHGASNFGSGSRTTLFHHELLCYKHDLAQCRQRETDKLLNEQRPLSTDSHQKVPHTDKYCVESSK